MSLEPPRAAAEVEDNPSTRDARCDLTRIGWFVMPHLVSGIGQDISEVVGASLTVDLRRLEPYVTGTGRTIAEGLPLLWPRDRVVVREAITGVACAQVAAPASTLAVTLDGARRRTLSDRVWQPWMFGPVGSTATLLGIYDLIPLRLGRSKAALLRRRLADVRRQPSMHLLTLLAGTKDRLVNEFGIPEERIHVVAPGVDGPAHVAVQPTAPPLDRPHVLVVARCSPHKNLALLLKAWRLSGKRTALVLVLPPQDATTRFARRASATGVIIRSGLSESDLGTLTGGAAAVMSPSLEEGFGLPAVEAAAMHAPLVLSDIAAYRELPVDEAVLVRPSDVDGWVDAFRAAADGQLLPSRLRSNAPTWDSWRAGLQPLLARLRGA